MRSQSKVGGQQGTWQPGEMPLPSLSLKHISLSHHPLPETSWRAGSLLPLFPMEGYQAALTTHPLPISLLRPLDPQS